MTQRSSMIILKQATKKNSFFGSLFFILLIVLVLLTVFGIVYIYVTSKNKERLALIEKGMDPNLANSDFFVLISVMLNTSSSVFTLLTGLNMLQELRSSLWPI